jgi:hypothetical protein
MFAQLYLLPIFHLCSLLAAKLGHKYQLLGRIFLILIKEEKENQHLRTKVISAECVDKE